MDWSNERYVRLYTRDTLNWELLTWQAQGLLMAILRKVDRAGVIDLGSHRPERAVAVVVRWPIGVVSEALPELVDSGAIELSGGALVLPNFLEAQEATSSQAQRQRDSRERRRDKARRRDIATVTVRDVGRDDVVTLRDDLPEPASPLPSVPCQPFLSRPVPPPPKPPALEEAYSTATEWSLRVRALGAELGVAAISSPFGGGPKTAYEKRQGLEAAIAEHGEENVWSVIEHTVRRVCAGTLSAALLARMFIGDGFGARMQAYLDSQPRKPRLRTPPQEHDGLPLTEAEQDAWLKAERNGKRGDWAVEEVRAR